MNLLLRSIRRMRKVLLLTLLGIPSIIPAMAYESLEDITLRTPVGEAVLDSIRGGFQRDSDGPFISFGIDRSVFINGKLINSTAFNISDMTQFVDRHDISPSAGYANMKPFVDHSSDPFMLIQNGPGNSFPHDISSLSPFMTVIQNSLDNQTIQSDTVINATVQGLTWIHALYLGDALSQANIDAIRQ